MSLSIHGFGAAGSGEALAAFGRHLRCVIADAYRGVVPGPAMPGGTA